MLACLAMTGFPAAGSAPERAWAGSTGSSTAPTGHQHADRMMLHPRFTEFVRDTSPGLWNCFCVVGVVARDSAHSFNLRRGSASMSLPHLPDWRFRQIVHALVNQVGALCKHRQALLMSPSPSQNVESASAVFRPLQHPRRYVRGIFSDELVSGAGFTVR